MQIISHFYLNWLKQDINLIGQHNVNILILDFLYSKYYTFFKRGGLFIKGGGSVVYQRRWERCLSKEVGALFIKGGGGVVY